MNVSLEPETITIILDSDQTVISNVKITHHGGYDFVFSYPSIDMSGLINKASTLNSRGALPHVTIKSSFGELIGHIFSYTFKNYFTKDHIKSSSIIEFTKNQ